LNRGIALLTFAEILDDTRPGSHRVACRNGERIDLAQLRGEVAHNAENFERLGVRRAVLHCEDGYGFVVALLALLRIGADIVMPPNLQPGTIAGLCDRFDAIVTDQAASALARRIALEPAAPSARPFRFDASLSRIDFFTSGSTGAMKRLEKRAAMLEREAAMLERRWGERIPDATHLGTVTHQHIFGLAFRIVWPLLSGRPFDGAVHFAWETLLGQLPRGAVVVSSPAHLSRLGGLSPIAPERRPALIFTAGAPLPAAAARDCTAIIGGTLVEIFGSTETGAFAWRSGPDQPLWHPLPGVEVSSSAAGLLQVRSPALADGECCALADRITPAEGGSFRFEGRADRIVKVEGKRVSLQKLEQDLIALPWIEAAAVVPVAGERVVLGAVVALSQAGSAELSRLGKFRFERLLRRALATSHDAAALPRRWRFVSELPLDGMGKRRSADLLALLEASA
jgi:acyl-coenzyme A synthetase/AMP-(fatty) acid ligase